MTRTPLEDAPEDIHEQTEKSPPRRHPGATLGLRPGRAGPRVDPKFEKAKKAKRLGGP